MNNIKPMFVYFGIITGNHSTSSCKSEHVDQVQTYDKGSDGYCLLTPLMSPQYRKCILIDLLID